MDVDRTAVRSEFERREPLYKRLREEGLFILERGLAAAEIKYHSLLARIKTLDSLVDKVARKEAKFPFSEISDIVGLRVVCLFLSDIARVGEAIGKQFDVVSEDNKIEGAAVSSFGYMSVHFVVRIKKSHSGPRYDGLAELPFEIQVRTIAMDAWATISHYLQYKSDIDVPKELRRDFYALSGLFYVADSHFEMFFKARERTRLEITAGLEKVKPNLQQEINLDSLKAYLLSRFSDREHSADATVSDLVTELYSGGYKLLSQIDEAIGRGSKAFLEYERASPPADGPQYTDVGVVRGLLAITDENFQKLRGDSANYAPYRAQLTKKPAQHPPEQK
jgi:putative GTP pyrophosphokinase